MSNIKVNLPADPFSGQIVTFPAPCDCASVTDGLSINGEIYTVCDAMGKCVTGVGGTWAKGAQVSVVLDCENKKAFIISTGSYAPAEIVSKVKSVASLDALNEFVAATYSEMSNHSKKCVSVNCSFSNIATAPSGGAWLLEFYRTDDQYGCVTARSYGSKGNRVMERSVFGGAWKPWEWVNPSMEAGVEYRTTERYNDKAVYKKADANGRRFWRVDGETTWRREDTDTTYISLVDGGSQAITDVGWYRVAKSEEGGYSPNCSALIKVSHGRSTNGGTELLFHVSPATNTITVLNNTYTSTPIITKIRLVRYTSYHWAVDVYYSRAGQNVVSASILSLHIASREVTSCNLTPVAETVSGETVVSEYEIAFSTGGSVVTDTMLGSMGVAKVATGSYTGTGTSGASNKCSLTFEFEPKMVVICLGAKYYSSPWGGIPWANPSTVGYVTYTDSTGATLGWSGNTLTWYHTSADNQLNRSGYKYHWVAIG